ncbi:MAG: hypothetical protein RIR11_1021 [Bacteroidota bacterium]|jgi:hypothetical protein
MLLDRKYLIVFSLFCFGLLPSSYQKGCSGAKASVGAPRPATDIRSTDFLQKKLAQRQNEMASVQSLTARARIYSESEGMNISANANIIWIRDSIIWMNAKKFGLEAMRVLITRDSVFALNRLEKTCTVASLESLRMRFSLPEGDVFDLLQKTVLGLPAINFKSSNSKSDIAESMHRLKSDFDPFSGEYRIEEGSFLLKNEVFVKKTDNTTIAIKFDKHQKINDVPGLFSYFRRVDAFSTEYGKQGVDIDMEDVQINTKPNFKFEIPDHYEKIRK